MLVYAHKDTRRIYRGSRGAVLKYHQYCLGGVMACTSPQAILLANFCSGSYGTSQAKIPLKRKRNAHTN